MICTETLFLTAVCMFVSNSKYTPLCLVTLVAKAPMSGQYKPCTGHAGQPYKPCTGCHIRAWKTARNLRSSSMPLLHKPTTRTYFADCTFRCTGPSV